MAFLAVGAAAATWLSSASQRGTGESSSLPSLPENSAKIAHEVVKLAKLEIAQPPPGRADEALSLGLSARNLARGGFVVLRGLPKGTLLSEGRSAGDDSWWLSTSDLPNVTILPPPRFVGEMEVTVELRFSDATVSDKRTLHLQWLEPVEQKPAIAQEPQARAPAAAPRTLSAEESAALLKRGNDLIASGDLAAARLVLRRAAEAGNAHAALLLAGTYDPARLEKWRVHGFSADSAMARFWYEKAEELGSREASGRKKLLADKPD